MALSRALRLRHNVAASRGSLRAVAATARPSFAAAAMPRGPAPARDATSDARQKALDAALKQIESAMGRGTVMRLGERHSAEGIEVISTGSLTLDVALGIGGLPRG